jgi:hypothetical protein
MKESSLPKLREKESNATEMKARTMCIFSQLLAQMSRAQCTYSPKEVQFCNGHATHMIKKSI